MEEEETVEAVEEETAEAVEFYVEARRRAVVGVDSEEAEGSVFFYLFEKTAVVEEAEEGMKMMMMIRSDHDPARQAVFYSAVGFFFDKAVAQEAVEERVEAEQVVAEQVEVEQVEQIHPPDHHRAVLVYYYSVAVVEAVTAEEEEEEEEEEVKADLPDHDSVRRVASVYHPADRRRHHHHRLSMEPI